MRRGLHGVVEEEDVPCSGIGDRGARGGVAAARTTHTHALLLTQRPPLRLPLALWPLLLTLGAVTTGPETALTSLFYRDAWLTC